MWPRWCQGPTGSGKTTWLLEQLRGWATSEAATLAPGQSLLVFVANGDNRLRLTETLARYTQGTIPVVTTTPNGFIQDEITLFWPLLVPFLGPLPQFPVRLRPENEQELATRFWQDKLWDGSLRIEGWQDQQTVRRSLDFCKWRLRQLFLPKIWPLCCRRACPPVLRRNLYGKRWVRRSWPGGTGACTTAY